MKLKYRFRRVMFKIIIWIIRKYFADGLEPIWGTNKKVSTIVAYRWTWTRELERNI